MRYTKEDLAAAGILEKLQNIGKISGVAIISHDNQVISMPAPNRHHHVIKYMADELKHPTPIVGVQGFITEDGTFLDRVMAKYVARYHKQLLDRASNLDELFSECVW